MKLSRYKHTSPVSYAFGTTLCYELYKTKPELITRVFLRPIKKQGEDVQKTLDTLRAGNVEIIEGKKAFNILGAKDNCLMMAEFKKQEQELDPKQAHIVLVNPSDAGNLGTIIRSAAAFNFHNLAIIDPAVDQYVPKAVRASMGALVHLNIKHYDSYESYQAEFPEHQGYAFMLDKRSQKLEKLLQSGEQKQLYSLVFGNEASGLADKFAKLCQPVILQQSELVDSLNLSIAASVAMYNFSTRN